MPRGTAFFHTTGEKSGLEATRSYLMYRLKRLSCEAFLCLFLDNRHRVIQIVKRAGRHEVKG